MGLCQCLGETLFRAMPTAAHVSITRPLNGPGAGPVPVRAPGLVPWRGGVPERVTDADERANGSRALRGRARGDGDGKGGTDHRGRTQASAMEGGRVQETAQGRSCEGEAGAAIASRNDANSSVHRATAASGQPGLCESFAVAGKTGIE